MRLSLNLLLIIGFICITAPIPAWAGNYEDGGIVDVIKSIKIKPCEQNGSDSASKASKDCDSDNETPKKSASDEACPENMVLCKISGSVVCASKHACERGEKVGIDASQTASGGDVCKTINKSVRRGKRGKGKKGRASGGSSSEVCAQPASHQDEVIRKYQRYVEQHPNGDATEPAAPSNAPAPSSLSSTYYREGYNRRRR